MGNTLLATLLWLKDGKFQKEVEMAEPMFTHGPQGCHRLGTAVNCENSTVGGPWQHRQAIPKSGRLRQKDQGFKVSLNRIERPCLKTQTSQVLVAHAFNPSIRKAEAVGSL